MRRGKAIRLIIIASKSVALIPLKAERTTSVGKQNGARSAANVSERN